MQLDDLLKGPIAWFWAFAKEIIYDKVCYAIGWIAIRIFTLGRNPANSLMDGLMDLDEDESWASLVGLLIIIGIGSKLYFLAGD